MANELLTNEIIILFRAGKVSNISQCIGVVNHDPKWRSIGTPQVREIVFALESAKLLVRETVDGITRFRWYNNRCGDE